MIRRGEVLAIVGPNGAGKSTLLRMMAMIERPSSGFVEFLDQRAHAQRADAQRADAQRADAQRFDAEKLPSLEARRRIVYLFQQPQLLNQSAFANVAYGLRVRGQRGQQDIAARVDQALAQVGMSHLKHENARKLSGGEAQRIALARAFVIEPDILLMDEPTANLDPANVGVIEGVIRQLGQRGTTLVLVTHNVPQARRLAQRVALMLEGNVVEAAPVQQFFESPSDPRTAAFVRGELIC